MTRAPTILSQFFRIDHACFTGYAFDKKDLSRRFVVELLIDGIRIGATVADCFSEQVEEMGMGEACHGFVFTLTSSIINAARVVEARLANLNVAVGSPIFLEEIPEQIQGLRSHGAVTWAGALKFTGWTPGDGEETPWVRAYIDGEIVGEARANRWRHVDYPHPGAMRAFELHLPLKFADGLVWRSHFKLDDGRELAGSPISFCAYERGLEQTLAQLCAPPGQKLQGRLFDQLMPGSLPFSDYQTQQKTFKPEPRNPHAFALGVVLLEGGELEASLNSLEKQSHDEWTCAALTITKDAFTFAADELAHFVHNHAVNIEWFLFALPGVIFDQDALARFADCIHRHPNAPLLYSDFEIITSDGVVWPVALPAFDYERLLEQGYFCAAFVVSRQVVEHAINHSVSNFFRIANIAFDSHAAVESPIHLPGPAFSAPQTIFKGAGATLRIAALDHLAARGVSCEAHDLSNDEMPLCRIRRHFAIKPRISILIPTRNRVDLLSTCLDSLYSAAARARAEIIVIDNDSSDAETLRYLRKIKQDGVKIISAPGAFNFSRINNLGARAARGDFLCFLNNDIVAQDTMWLEEMISRHVDESVGAVGAKLLWPSRIVQHGGVVLGVNFGPVHAFCDRIDDDPGYYGLLRAAHACSAITAACMTTSRAAFFEVGGFDEILFPINFNDVDYCLKLGAMGRRIIFTPHARLIHKESASRKSEERLDSATLFQRELRNLRNKWGATLAHDPYYSPLLALSDPPYSDLAWPPRSLEPRSHLIPPARSPPSGF